MKRLTCFIISLGCSLIFGCSGVQVIGHYMCPDGKRIDYVQTTCKVPPASTELVALDRYMHDPKTNVTKLIRSDAAGTPSSAGKLVDEMKQFLPFLIVP
jgi:hypothetical protein